MGMGQRLIRVLRAAIVAAGAMLAADARSYVIVYEFYNAAHDHYFRTASVREARDLDAHPERGWARTGHDFAAYDADRVGPGIGAVCRFYASIYTSHFYTADATECDLVAARWPGVWQFEEIAFASYMPQGQECVPSPYLIGQDVPIPIYRVYNNTTEGNHRYVVDPALYAAMQERGWLGEGVKMCAIAMTPEDLDALEKVLTLAGNWRFDSPMTFARTIGWIEALGNRGFGIGATYTLPDGSDKVGLSTYYDASTRRFHTSRVISRCSIFLFSAYCDYISFEFGYGGDFDHVSGTKRTISAGGILGGPSDNSDRFEGARQ